MITFMKLQNLNKQFCYFDLFTINNVKQVKQYKSLQTGFMGKRTRRLRVLLLYGDQNTKKFIANKIDNRRRENDRLHKYNQKEKKTGILYIS